MNQANVVYKFYRRQTTNIGFLLRSLQCGQVLTQTEFYNHHPTCRAGSVVQSLCDKHGIRGSTFYKWLLQYSTNGQFKRDARGLWADNFLDHNEDVKAKLTDWLRCLKDIDVDSTWDYINDTLLSDWPVGRLCGSSGLVRPISRPTAISWMKTCGVVLKTRGKGYFVDTHERWDNQLYRACFCILVMFIELRQPRWLCISHARKLELQVADKWVSDELATRIPASDCVATSKPPRLHVVQATRGRV
jgi:transposase-like protein